MKTKQLICQNCGAKLDVNGNIAFCSYCGAQLVLEDDKKETITTHNYNHNYTKRDEGRIRENERIEKVRLAELEHEEKQDKRDTKIGLIAGLGIPLFIALAIFLGLGINKWSAQAQGKIQAGYYKDLVGQDYKSVVAHFEAAGFTNIETIDLNDSGLLFWTDGQVTQISVGGDTDFETLDWFDPDTKVVISHH